MVYARQRSRATEAAVFGHGCIVRRGQAGDGRQGRDRPGMAVQSPRDLLMHDESTYRTLLALGFAAVLPFMLYHRIRSQATGEPLDRSQEGLFILATLRPVGIACMIALVTYVASPARMAWSSMPLPPWARLPGHRPLGRRDRPAGLDAQQPRAEPHGHGRDAESAYPRQRGTVPLGAAPVLRRGVPAPARKRHHRGELVHPGFRHAGVHADGGAYVGRGTQPRWRASATATAPTATPPAGSCHDSRATSELVRPPPSRRAPAPDAQRPAPSAYSSVFQCTASKSIASARPSVMCLTICAA